MEYFEIFNEQGKLQGTAPRREVHEKGYWHKAVNIIIQRSNDDLIIQLRSKNKDVWPDAWDFSVCEHLQPGESFEEAAIRGLHEELGIEKCTLIPIDPICISKVENQDLKLKDFEFQQCFTAKYDGPFSLDDDEVAAIRWISPGQLKKEMSQKSKQFTPWFREFMNSEMIFRS